MTKNQRENINDTIRYIDRVVSDSCHFCKDMSANVLALELCKHLSDLHSILEAYDSTLHKVHILNLCAIALEPDSTMEIVDRTKAFINKADRPIFEMSNMLKDVASAIDDAMK